MSREQKIAGRLLVVDDTPAHLKMLAGALLQSGFEVETAEGGTQALAAADRNPPDLVLLDVDMPQPDGYETCRRLKAQERFANTPIIFLSGLSNVADKVAGFAAGGVDFVTKPFDIEEVKVRISTHLELASGKLLGAAVRTARKALFDAHVPDWGNFLLFGDDALAL